MTVLTDVSVDWWSTPRVVTFGLTVNSVTIQDIMDTLRVIEAEPWNMPYDNLILPRLTGGKQPLNAAQTKKVGLTITLYNAKIQFAARASQTFIPVEDGNMVAIQEDGQTFFTEPFEPSTNVNILYAADTTASIVESGTSGLTAAESAALLSIEADVATLTASVTAINGNIATIQTDIGFIQADISLVNKILKNKKITYKSGPNKGWMFIYDDDDTTVLLKARIWQDDGLSIPYAGFGLEATERLAAP